MWIAKEGEIRRQEFLDTALALFIEEGYERTSINDILKKMGVTKGAFYYYFKSKEDLLDILCTRQAEAVIAVVEKIAHEDDASALEKINRIIRGVFAHRAAHREERIQFTQFLENEANLKLANRISEYILSYATPLIRSILEQGVREGTFHVTYPEECAALYIQLSSIMNYALTRLLSTSAEHSENEEATRVKTLFFEEVFAKLLGAEPGTITLSTTVMEYYFGQA